jgi:ParB-like chromosome segregation protein Spo0J
MSSKKYDYKVHPIANIFPMMSPAEFEALKADIKEHGLRESITFWKNMLVDGRNRLKACEELGIEPDECELMQETDPVAWVISHNLHRRHLTESQRAAVAGKLAKRQKGDNQYANEHGQICPSTKEVAKMFNISEMSVKHAKKVLSCGSEEVQQAVEQGSLPVSVASELVKAVPDKQQQTEIVNKGVDAVRQAVKSKPLAQKRLTKEQAAEKRKQANASPMAGLDSLRKAWMQASQEARKEFLKEVKHELSA